MEILGVNGEKLYSRNLRDLLSFREEEHHRSASGSSSGVTLYAVLTEKRRIPPPSPPPVDEPLRRIQSTRTLLDIINEERISTPQFDSRKSWRNLTEKIRLLRRSGVSEAEPYPILEEAIAVLENRSETTTNNENQPSQTVASEPEPPARMSLMALLAENDRQINSDVRISEEELELEVRSGENNNCCVCMLRQKGAAFIPCGHTFCRRCSREVWVQRGNCPLCNNPIVEILDIF